MTKVVYNYRKPLKIPKLLQKRTKYDIMKAEQGKGGSSMKQISLFAEENRMQKLSVLGDCLEQLKIIDWESFRPIIALALIRERKSNAGRRPFDSVMLLTTEVKRTILTISLRGRCCVILPPPPTV